MNSSSQIESMSVKTEFRIILDIEASFQLINDKEEEKEGKKTAPVNTAR